MSFTFDNLRQLTVEVTTHCNSSCGECTRNIRGGAVWDRLKLEHMSIFTWIKIITSENLENIDVITLNGNYGDAMMHPMLIQMLTHLIEVKPSIAITIHSNAGVRDKEFYTELGKLLKDRPHRIIFGLDGLADTHSLYRRGVDFDKVIENAKAFIDAGGIAVWRYIVFDHNIHQIDEAYMLSKKIGFKEFKLNRSVKTPIEMDAYHTYPSGVITAPPKEQVYELYKKYNKSIDDYIQSKNESVCPWAQSGKMQIDVYGKLWPCCYFSLDIFGGHERKEYLNELDAINDLRTHSLEQVLSNDYFKSKLPTYWQQNTYKRCNKCQGKHSIE